MRLEALFPAIVDTGESKPDFKRYPRLIVRTDDNATNFKHRATLIYSKIAALTFCPDGKNFVGITSSLHVTGSTYNIQIERNKNGMR